MDYNRDRSGGRSGGGFGWGNRRSSGWRDGGGRAEMFRTTCDECGDSCEVPFRPSGDKPVYCSHCFKSMDWGWRDSGRNEYRGDRDNRGRRDDFSEKQMFEVVCAECGKDCEVPFKPTTDRPVFCSDCFVKEDKSKPKNDFKVEFENLNAKLNLIIKFLEIPDGKKEKVKIKLLKEINDVESEVSSIEEEIAESEVKVPAKKAVKKITKKDSE